ncbi:MAG: hypothetical protein KGI06_05455 [Candidatus Micrarchaeota archaeon]|nr:hypothetical protein [Candidatus Micrarchaeota archaeon]
MTSLVTWTSQNGYSSIQWQDLSEITIFHVYPLSDGSIVYDGSGMNISAVIANAHSHGVKVCLAVGGSGSPAWDSNNKILNSPSLRSALVNNLASEISSKGYDCLHWDFENNAAGDFNANNYTAIIQLSRQVLPSNIKIDCTFAPWETSVNVTAIAPYCDHLMYMFNPSVSQLNAYASAIGGTSKLMAGYDLASADGSSYHVPTLSELLAMKTAGYGMFFWDAEYANASFYSTIAQAYSGIISTTQITTSSSTTTTAATSLTTIAAGSSSTSTPSTTASTTTASTTTVSTGGTGGGGGGSGGGGGPSTGGGVGRSGGGGGSSVPVISYSNGCAIISNVAVPNTFSFTIGANKYTATDNYIGSNYTSVIINGSTYIIMLNGTLPVGGVGLRLVNVSYLPILHSVTFKACPSNSSASNSKDYITLNFSATPPVIVSTQPSNLSISLADVLDMPVAPEGTVIYSAIEVKASGISSHTTLAVNAIFQCGLENIKPYILQNGSWSQITPYIVNGSACTVGFVMHNSSVIALAVPEITPANQTRPNTTISEKAINGSTIGISSGINLLGLQGGSGSDYLLMLAGLFAVVLSIGFAVTRSRILYIPQIGLLSSYSLH